MRKLVLSTILIMAGLVVGCHSSGPTAPPTGKFIASFSTSAPDDYVEGKMIYFDASGSADSLIKITEYVWDFGDGTDPVTTETPGATHVFAKPKTYTLKLTILDQAGRTASTSRPLAILLPGKAPQACFTYDAPDGWQPDKVMNFDASCSSDVGK